MVIIVVIEVIGVDLTVIPLMVAVLKNYNSGRSSGSGCRSDNECWKW